MAECVSRAGMASVKLSTNLFVILRTIFQLPGRIEIRLVSVGHIGTLLLGAVTLSVTDSAEHAPISCGDATLAAEHLAAVFVVLDGLACHHQPALLRADVVVDLILAEKNLLVHVQNWDALALLNVPDTLVTWSSIQALVRSVQRSTITGRKFEHIVYHLTIESAVNIQGIFEAYGGVSESGQIRS